MNTSLLSKLIGLVGVLTGISAAPTANASTGILVGQCVENAACYIGQSPTPFSTTLTGAQLASFGLGSTQSLTAAQTSQFVIQLGVTTADFSTPGGPVTETIGEFTGGLHSDPCNFCEIDTVGSFMIPIDATSAQISGTFGNSTFPNSGGVNVYFGPFSGVVPEPATWALMLIGLGGLGASLRDSRRKAAASTV